MHNKSCIVPTPKSNIFQALFTFWGLDQGSTPFGDPTPKTNILQAVFNFWGWIRGAHLSKIQPPKLIFSRHCLLFGVGSGEHIFPRSNPQNSYFPGFVYFFGLDQGSTSFRDPTPKTSIFKAVFTFWGWIRGAHLSEIQPPKLIFSRHCLLFGVGSGEHTFPRSNPQN